MSKLKSAIIMAACASAISAQAYVIYPTPQKITESNGTISISTPVNIVAGSGIDEITTNRLKEVLDKSGIEYTVSEKQATGRTDIVIGVYGSGDTADGLAATQGIDTSIFPEKEGGYDPHAITISSDDDCGTIMILGNDNGSAYYGCASLEQILEQTDGSRLDCVKIEDYAHVKYRGFMEGFYGHPYSMESRLNLLEYCKRYKMNYYGYGPKADPYHAGNWRLEYPETITDTQRNLGQITRSDIRTIAEKARECNVDFVWVAHPSLGSYSINLSWVPEIITKFETLYNLGIRHFGVSVDDMNGHPSNQGQLADQVQKQVDAKWNTADAAPADRVGPVLFTPTAYALNYSGASYILPSLASIDSKIDVAFTGYDCFSNVRASSFATMADYIGRDPIFWWNNPVNDDYDGFLYMHGMTARWTIENQGAIPHMKGFLLNPMNQGQASKIAIFSGADYAWNPNAFNADKSWEASLQSIVKTHDYTNALKEFIRVMSAYTTKDTSTPEGEEYASLYTSFRNAYSKNSIPDASELTAHMRDAYDACLKLAELKNSDDADQHLFYTDIEPWLKKVTDMTYIVYNAIDLMNGEGDLDHWTDFIDLADKASDIHTNSLFSVLEGSGTGTYETFKEAQPTPKYLDPFVDFLAAEIPSYSLELPQRSREPEIITNITNLSGVTITTNNGNILLSGLNGKILAKGEYIGIFFNYIQTITIDMLPTGITDKFSVEHSVNGKEWTSFTPDGVTETEMAYFRIKNTSANPLTLTTDDLTFDIPTVETPADAHPLATTNMGTYENYTISNVIDGDYNTKFWSSAAPVAGESYIQLDFEKSAPRTDIVITFNSNDQPSGNAEIQISDDGTNWNRISTFTSADIVNNVYRTTANGQQARYVRLFIATTTSIAWLQVMEFEVTTPATSSASSTDVTEDNNGNQTNALDDRSLLTYYTTSDAGYLTYRFIENINIEEIHIYHNSSFTDDAAKPTISILADGKWIEAGRLDAPRTIVTTSALSNIAQLKIQWNKQNIPAVYEIIPVGTPYVEDAGQTSSSDIFAADEATIGLSDTAYGITVTSSDIIACVTITDVLGRILSKTMPDTDCVSLPLYTHGTLIVSVDTQNGTNKRFKIAR